MIASFLPILCLYVAAVTLPADALAPTKCRKGQFVRDRKCVPCSKCPANYIVTERCSNTEDTVCGSFKMQDGNLDSLTLVGPKRPQTDDDEVKRENATECYLEVRKETIMIKVLIGALVVVTFSFVSYVFVTRCCQSKRKDQNGSSCDQLITTTTVPAEMTCAESYFTAEQNFVIGPDGTKISEEQFMRNPLRALTGRGRSQVQISGPVRPHCVAATATAIPPPQNEDAVSLTNSDLSAVTIDF